MKRIQFSSFFVFGWMAVAGIANAQAPKPEAETKPQSAPSASPAAASETAGSAAVEGFGSKPAPAPTVPSAPSAPPPGVSDVPVAMSEELPMEEVLKIRDPFAKPILESASTRAKSELETYSAEDFKVVGVITGPDRIKAMILGPNGKTYFISEGDRIGLRKGVVRQIHPDYVKVVEKVTNVFGKEESVVVEIRFPGEQTNPPPSNDNG